MAKKSKNSESSSYSNVDLGKGRKERIEDFRAKKRLEGTRYDYLDDAINYLIDRGLQAEAVNA